MAFDITCTKPTHPRSPAAEWQQAGEGVDERGTQRWETPHRTVQVRLNITLALCCITVLCYSNVKGIAR
ncbi:hypothetical protein BHE74_00039681 [Ensete ventricosum]|nr:hypothetical protein BHE74_00039681 [Ensete ventricosum]